jgi:hypothetical protein
MSFDLHGLIKKFNIYGDLTDIKDYGSGHINDTYCAVFEQAGSQVRYILQRINQNVFPDPKGLMENVIRVTNHIRGKLEEAVATDISRKVLTLVPTLNGDYYFVDGDGNYWRVYMTIERARTHDVLQTMDQAYEAAKAFGEYQCQLSDLPEPALFETIKDFHNGPKRYQTFLDVLKKDPCNRAAGAKAEIDFLNEHAWIFDVLPKLVEEGKIPVRTTHNDTKINNVMLDNATGKGICVIDLDTTMPGLSLYDFGDIVRTTASPTEEDEMDLSKVGAQLPRLEAVLKGYLSSAGGFLNSYEKDNLVLGGEMITLMIGTRFLTDHLDGDNYFKIHREGHNLDRCRTQFKLVESILAQEEQIKTMVSNFG